MGTRRPVLWDEDRDLLVTDREVIADITSFRVMIGSGDDARIGLVPRPPTAAATTLFLRQDGTWAAPSGGGGGVSDGDYGDVVVSGSATVWTIDSGVVTLAKMANIATDRLIGRDTAGTGVPEALTVTGGVEFTGSGGIQRSALTGDVTASAGSTTTAISSSVITTAARTVLDDATVAAMLATLGGAPDSAQYVTLATSSLLSNERVLTAGTGISLTDAGAGSTITVAATTGNATTRYDPDQPTSQTYVDPTQEFADSQSAGGWTNTIDTSSILAGSTIGPAGLEITTITASAAIGGKYHSTFPSGDFEVLAKIHLQGSGTAARAGIGLMQGTGSTDDIYFAGIYNGGYLSLDRRAWGSYFTAYATPGADLWFQACGGDSVYVLLRYKASNHHVTTWAGSHPDSLGLVHLDYTMANAATAIGCFVGGVSGAARYTRATFEFVRVIADTYDGTGTDTPTRLTGLRVADH